MKKYKTRKKKLKPLIPFLLWGFASFVMLAVYFLHGLPDIDKARPLDIKPSISILANDGTMIARYGGVHGNTLTISDLPRHLVVAVLSVEDRRFYSHFGVDPLGLARAMAANAWARRWVQGGSTITQQLAKNMFLTPEKTLRRKVQEALMAFKIERAFTKDEILTAYLNRVYFGAGAYGVDAAAKVYFSKPASSVSLWEGAVLAGLLKAPSRFSPATNPDLAERRAKVVIETMVDAGYIDDATAEREIKNSRVQKSGVMAGDLNRYFADWVLSQLDTLIADMNGDLVVRTTLDPKLQLMAEARQKALFKKLKPEDQVTQAALVTQAHDGAVLAMIGGVDYNTSQFNRAVQALRQPGSTFKPFVFLAALESGFAPDNKIEDGRLQEGRYRPDNYENKYYGTVTLTQALAKSLNTATIRLLQLVGVERLIDVARRAGFTRKLPFELSTGLGTGEVTLLELTNAYAIIANGGASVWPYAVLSIRDGQGELLYQYKAPDHPRVFASRDIAALDHMLEVAIADGTGTAGQLSRGHVAGKTGTTQNYRDAWFLGYTDNLVTGVWMGNDDAAPMKTVTGGKYPAQLWRSYMNEAINFDVAKFRPEPMPGGNAFFDMLSHWTTTDSAAEYNE